MARYSSSRYRGSDIRRALLFILPTYIILFVFIIVPIFFAFYLSFHKWNLLGSMQWVGISNYRKLFHSDEFWKALVNTFYYSFITVPVGIVISLLLAMLLNSKIKGIAIYRTVYFMPVMTSVVASAFIWQWIFQSQNGILNYLFGFIGLKPLSWLNEPKGIFTVFFESFGKQIPKWLGGPSVTLVAISIMTVWKNTGYYMIIFLAGLQNIPKTLYEAAEMDGAGPIKSFFSITLPILSPTTYFVLIMSVIVSFQVFEQVAVTTQGGPLNASLVLVYFIYQRAFKFLEVGYASSAAYILFAIVLLLTYFQVKTLGKRIHY
ncbi:MAG: sugar ABC transporter permease [Spirochaetota bacterium]|nr:MAG: sugar ABC transporter permease [Spirochaetota bacterium]